MEQYGFRSKILHSDRLNQGNRLKEIEHGSLHKPVHNSIAYGYKSAEDLAGVFQGTVGGFGYSRQANPTVEALEMKINLMEGGVETVCFASGMAAIGSLLQSLLVAGDHFIASKYLFGNTNSLFETAGRLGISVDMVDACNTDEVASKIRPETKMVFVETIANPMTQIPDMKNIGKLCAENQILYVVDNTMTTPVLFDAKRVGASLVINSLSKYISGHGNALGGSITDTGLFDWGSFANISEPYLKFDPPKRGIVQIRKKSLRDFGATMSPQNAHLISVGSDTLDLRMKQACENASALAKMLAEHENVAEVFHPSLATHPQHELAKELFCGFGAVLSFVPKDSHHCFKVLDSMNLVVASSNLGDNRTLAIPVAHTIFFEMGLEKRKERGIAENTIRVSVGIENTEDLLKEFSEALK